MRNVDVIKDHYGPLTSASYDQATKSFWAYNSTLEAIAFELAYGRGLVTQDRPLTILDLGSGTGNLIELIFKMFPKERLRWHAVDQSKEMLQTATKKLGRQGLTIKSCLNSLQHLDFPVDAFDAVVSSFAIHHLNQTEKKVLFRKIYHFTKPKGIFVFGDRFTEPSQSCLKVAAAYFCQHGFMKNKKLEDVVQYMKNQFKLDGDQPSSEQAQLMWMKEAGWWNVRCPFRSFVCGVISGVKKE